MLKYTEHDLDIMALTVWAEARGESLKGQRAVAWVIRNRLESPGWWSRQKGDGIPDDTIEAVCRDPWQFSCWLTSDPQSHVIKNPDTLRITAVREIRKLCTAVLSESRDDDPSLGSDHYCTVAVIPKTRWAKDRTPVVVIGRHAFFRIGLDGNG